MGRIVVPRAECIDLGILGEDEHLEPDDSIDINGGLQANADKFSAALQKQLAKQAGLELLDGVLCVVANRAAMLNHNSYPDSLGRFTTAANSLSERDNIRRGRRAIERALRQKRDVREAMMVKGLGTVHFEWGRPGTPKLNEKGTSHADGYGISHIVAKRGIAAARKLPVVLARGQVLAHPKNPDKRVVKWDGWTAIAKKLNAGNSFVVSSIDDDLQLQKNWADLPGGQSALNEGGNRLAGRALRGGFHLKARTSRVPRAVFNIDRSRSALKQIAALFPEAP